MLQIKRIYKEDYPNGKKIIYEYSTDKYYDKDVEKKEVRIEMGLILDK